jgi:high-affinity nickel-transport protein
VSTLAAGGGWTQEERRRIAGILVAVAGLHVTGWVAFLAYASDLPAGSAFAGAGTLAYVLGVRHAFDADHIAAIDDTTRLMVQRGRRPVGVGFFFAMGHSSVVFLLAAVVALVAGSVSAASVESFRHVGALVSALVAMSFLLLVAGLNAVVLRGLTRVWSQARRGEVDQDQIDVLLVNRGLLNRVLGGRARSLIRSSWHMFPLGFLFGLGLETASEVTLLALSASTAVTEELPLVATLCLPVLFAAGMSAFDTCDGLLMTRAYSWSQRHPLRRLYYNIATTAMTIVIAGFVASVYLADLAARQPVLRWLSPYASLADRFEVVGYLIAAAFVLTWGTAALSWRLGGFDRESDRSDQPARQPG